jgi:hypothetical protein
VLLVRETPLHLGHLRLLVQVAEMGAVVMPPMPAFYHRPETLEALVDQTVNRVLDMLDITLDHDLFARWQGPLGKVPRDYNSETAAPTRPLQMLRQAVLPGSHQVSRSKVLIKEDA